LSLGREREQKSKRQRRKHKRYTPDLVVHPGFLPNPGAVLRAPRTPLTRTGNTSADIRQIPAVLKQDSSFDRLGQRQIVLSARKGRLNRNTPDKLGRTADSNLRHSTKAKNVSKAASILQMNDLERLRILQIDDELGSPEFPGWLGAIEDAPLPSSLASEPQRSSCWRGRCPQVDPVEAYFDPFDQGGEDSALAGHRQLGPVLSDPEDKGPNLSFQGRDRRPRSRSWLHLDLYTADQQAEVERLVALAQRLLTM
jgi:hypothetical protein